MKRITSHILNLLELRPTIHGVYGFAGAGTRKEKDERIAVSSIYDAWNCLLRDDPVVYPILVETLDADLYK